MKKILKAQKHKDGWIVAIGTTHIVFTKSDVLRIARYEGLKVNKKLSNDKEIIAE